MTAGERSPRASRLTSAATTAALARMGFAHTDRAAELVLAAGLSSATPESDPVLAAGLARVADPDLGLLGLVRLLDAVADPSGLRAALRRDPALRDRLLGALGASAALGDHLSRHPEQWRDIGPGWPERDRTPEAVRAELRAAPAGRRGPAAYDALRVAYRRRLLDIAAGDVAESPPMEHVAAALADLADAALTAALDIASAELSPRAEPCRLAVIGMGKCGGRELNYVSDVDVIFLAEPVEGGDEAAALRTATTLAAGMMRACSQTTAEGSLWPVDAGLRPEGTRGPLVRTLASHLAYYDRWAKTWEFQALLKARPVAGDADLGRAYLQAVAPLVWRAGGRPNFVEDVQAMRRRVVDQLPAGAAQRELKLGPGGLRDVEFSVQLLQLVHGRADETLRSGTTLTALAALAKGGYVGREDAEHLAAAYRFLRTLEHRLQLHRLRRTHVLPTAPEDLRRLGRSVGYHRDPAVQLSAELARHAREVRRLHEKLFYRPLLAAVARLPGEETRLTLDAARARLEALGYADPVSALRHLEALTTGVSRRAAIQRTLLPVLLGWFADAVDPDGGLLAFTRVSDALGSTHWYLRLLRDEGAVAERLAQVLASSRYAVDLLLRAPEAVAQLSTDTELRPRPGAPLLAEALTAVRRQDDPLAAAAAVRAVRRRELFRTATADVLGLLDIRAVGEALSTITVVTVAGGFEAAVRAVESERRAPVPTRIAIIGMGRLGGHEVGYSSDADVLFVHEPLPGADERAAGEAAHAVAHELRRLLAVPVADPPLLLDADLRPEGRQGPLVRTLASYAAYYARWSLPWEAQALLRAEPIAGDAELGRAFLALVEPLRWPSGGLSESQLREIRRVKARVEAERLPRGGDPRTHTKLGRGGLADVEWTVQLLQLCHAARLPALRTTRTLAALEAAVAEGLLDAGDGAALTEAWRMASRVRNATMLVRGRLAESLPADLRELSGTARVLGYPAGRTGELAEDYARVSRRARAVVERVFYG